MAGRSGASLFWGHFWKRGYSGPSAAGSPGLMDHGQFKSPDLKAYVLFESLSRKVYVLLESFVETLIVVAILFRRIFLGGI